MNKLDSILKQNAEIKDFKVFDTQMEWDLFLDKVESPSLMDTSKNKEQKETKYFTLYTVLKSIAAVFLLVFFCIWTLKKPENMMNTFNGAAGETIQLSDGSIITSKGGKIDYPKSFVGQKSRNIYLEGDAEFDIKKSILPFTVYAGKLRIDVLGTKFDILQSKDGVNIENKEGSVKVSEISNPKNTVTLQKGDKFQYIDGQFKNLQIPEVIEVVDTIVVKKNPAPKLIVKEEVVEVKEEVVVEEAKPVVEESGSTYKLGSVIKDFILKKNKDVIKIDKKFKYDPEMRVKLNLNLPYSELISILKNKGILDTKPGECEGCIIIIAPKTAGQE